MEYLESLRIQNDKINTLKSQVSLSLKDSQQSNTSDESSDANTKALASSVLTKKFMVSIILVNNNKIIIIK